MTEIKFQAKQLANGNYRVSYNGQTVEMTDAQLEQLRNAKTNEEIQAFFKPKAAEEVADQSQIEQLTQQQEIQAKKYMQDEENIRNLPPDYAEEYQEIEDNESLSAEQKQAQQTEVIKRFLADPKHNELKPVGPETVGSRHSVEHKGALEFSTTNIKDPLVDGDGKPIKETVEKQAEAIQQQFQRQMDEQLAEIDNNANLTTEPQKIRAKNNLILEHAFDTSFGPQVKALAEGNKSNPANVNKHTYFELAMSQEQKNIVADTRNKLVAEMTELLAKEELSQDEKDRLEKFKQYYDNNFPNENPFGKYKHLENLKNSKDPSDYKDTKTKLEAVALLMGIDEAIKKEQADANQLEPSTQLSADQMEKLARAQMKEKLTHENEIAKLNERISKLGNSAPDRKKNIENRIAKLYKQANKNMEDIKEGVAIDQANAHLRQQMYAQKFKNTIVHWDKSDSKEAEKANPSANNTYLNKYARKMIMNDADFRNSVCKDKDENGNPLTSGDFQVDGKWYKFDSDLYKNKMLKLSNPERGDFGIDDQHADYYAQTTEWVQFADKHAKKAEKRHGDGEAHADSPATMGERRHAREMFEIAGIETGGDRTYAKRGKAIGMGALIGAGTGALAGIGGELLASAQKIKYAGTAVGLAQGVLTQHISGIASTTVSGTAEADISGTVHVEGVATGEYSGTATTTVSGEVPVSGSTTVDLTSYIQEYNPKTGQYVTTATQTTPYTVDWSGVGTYSQDVAIPYSGTVEVPYSADVPYQQHVEIPYEQRVDIPYERDVEMEYSEEVPVDYDGKVRKGFDWGNVAKQAGIGAAIGAAVPALTFLFKKKNAGDYANTDTVRDYTRKNTGYQNIPKAPDLQPVKVTVEKMETVVEPGEPEPIPNTDHKMVVRRGRGTMAFRGQNVPFNEAEDKKYYVQQLYNVPDDKIDAVYQYIMEQINELRKGQYNDTQYVNGNTYHFPASLPKELTGLEEDYEQQDMSSYVPRWIKIPITTGRYTGFTGGQKGLEKAGQDKTSTTTRNRTDVYDKNGNLVRRRPEN